MITLRATVAALLLLSALLCLWGAARESATYDEPGHIAAGYAHLVGGDFRFDIPHAPLPKLLAAAAMYPLHPPVPTDGSAWKAGDSWGFGYQFLYGYGQGRELLFSARLPFILLGAALGLIVFGWARELWGVRGGLVALVLHAFNPEILAHAHYANSDLPIALMITLCLWGFWRFLDHPSLRRGAWVAGAAALAAVTKYNCVALLPMAGAVLLVRGGVLLRRRGVNAAGRLVAQALCVAVGAVLAAGVAAWACYGFRSSAAPVSGLTSPLSVDNLLPADSRLRSVLISIRDAGVLPEPYLTGLAYTAYRPSEERRSFVMGAILDRPVWYYFPVAFLLKTPLPFLVLVSLALVRRRAPDEPPLARASIVLPAAMYFAGATFYGFNIGYRHLLPIVPLLCVLAGRVVTTMQRQPQVMVAGVALLAWYVGGCFWVAPHFLSYFNELAGGPSGGTRYLVDSNCDWGQDLDELGRFSARHGIAHLKLSYFGTASVEAAHVPASLLPSVVSGWPAQNWASTIDTGDIVAVSVTNLRQVYFRDPNALPLRVDVPGRRGVMGFGSFVTYLADHYRPLGSAGYSILVYKVSPEYAR